MPLVPIKKKSLTPFERRKIVLCAPPKDGKTTLTYALCPDILNLTFERRHDDIEGYVFEMESWPKFLQALEELKKNQKDHPMISIDTLDSAYHMYHKWFLADQNIKHESEIKFGVAYAKLQQGFSNAFRQLPLLGRGYIIQTHISERMVGQKTITRPNYPQDKAGEMRGAITGICDAIWYLGWEPVVDSAGAVILTRTLFTQKSNDTEDFEIGTAFPMPAKVRLINDDPAGSAALIRAAYDKAQETAATAANEAAVPPQNNAATPQKSEVKK